jgi:uncharacterized protein with FMN-binding domain
MAVWRTVFMNEEQTQNGGLDAALAARLERLAAARTRQSAGAPTTTGTVSGRRRRHAARGSRRAALALSLAAVGALTYGFGFGNSQPVVQASAPAGIVTTPTASGSVPVTAGTPAPSSAATTATTVVNGTAYANKYGTVQVQATFGPDGAITSVDAIKVPNGDNKSVRINNQALPKLNSEAVVAQASRVDTVSGATYTSVDYRQSLQSAIDIARANAVTQLA